MKYCLYLLSSLALAQSANIMYTTDINGRRVEAQQFSSASKGDLTEVRQSVNGRLVPLEHSETRVVSESPNGKVTETIVRKYDPAGNLASTERTVSEEQKRPNGGSSIRATVYRTDVNGRMQEDERRTIETQAQGQATAQTTTADVVIARPSLSGSFENTEKRKVVTVAGTDATQESQYVYKLGTNGQFVETARETKSEKKNGGKTTVDTASYELSSTGQIQLWRQTASATTKASDGSQVTEASVYTIDAAGAAREERGGPKLKEQQTTIRNPSANGTVVETTTIRRPTLTDPNVLGEARQISETVCKGKCDAGVPEIK